MSENFIQEDKYCPKDCPFLSIFSQKIEGMPYRCGLFDMYLAFDKDIIKNPKCLGSIRHYDTKDGFNFINALQGTKNKSMIKWIFKRLSKKTQEEFISYLENCGNAISLSEYANNLEPEHVLTMESNILNIIKSGKEGQNNNEIGRDESEIQDLLFMKSEQFPEFLGKEEQTLISNLYKALDDTEKQIMKNILSNDNTLEVFVKSLQKKTKNDSLLKNVRREMDDIILKEEQKQKEQQQFLSMQQHMKSKNDGR